MDEKALSQIPQNLQIIVDRGQSTGMVALVARNGKIASVDAVGWRIKDKEPLETTDVFWAASITKSFVAVGIMMMVDEGHLKLDDLVEKHIPEFKGQKVKTGKKSSDTAKHPLTVRNLLNHLDGLPKNPTRNRATKSIKERVLKTAKDTLMWEPGTKWNYGGEGLYASLSRGKVFRHALRRVSEDPHARSSRHEEHLLYHQERAREPGGPQTQQIQER